MPLISIVIPTRNRPQYLLDSVEVVINNIKDVEIIVCDNSDENILENQLTDYIKRKIVKYYYSSEKLSVVDNFERAFLEVSGDYAMAIGDDDTVGPGLEKIVLWAKNNQIDTIISYSNSFIASYYWPGVKSKYFGNAYASYLFINEFTGSIQKIDPVKELEQVAKKLGGGLGRMPRIYHGLVSSSLLQEIYAKHGHLFGGISPDIYSATLIAGHCRNSVIIDFPFIIPGASPKSTAGQGAERSDRGDIKTTEHTERFGDKLIWDKRIPEFYSPQTVWAYSLCKALEILPHLKITPKFSRLYACCFLYHRKNYTELLRALDFLSISQGKINVLKNFIISLASELIRFLNTILTKLLHPRAGGRAMRSGPHEKISAAYIAIDKYIHESGKKLNLK